ncbi:hypothetical protein ACTWP5_23555 [Streptomyces sp. 4N509B]|uniref:hypothetical protein n=1 Tax=Streptomyces sp. 4N509B TaxID=3457413 RepID=UPI003FD44652
MSHRRPIAAGLLSAALLLTGATACSSDDSDSGDDAIDGAQSPGEETPNESTQEPTESESQPPDDGIDRPELVLPANLELIIEEVETGDPVVEAILYDHEQRIAADYAAMTAQDTQHEAISFYYEGEAQARILDVLETIIDDNIVSAGTVRYFNREVNLLNETAAIVTFCRDYSETYDADADTGEIINEAEPSALPTYYTERVEINEDGVWEAVEFGTEQEDSACR